MALFFIFAAVILRIAPYVDALNFIPHLPNFAPVAAMALFSGVYLNKKYALAIPLAAMAISDIIIGTYNVEVMISVYACFILMGLAGMWLKKHKSVQNIVGITLGGSVLFYLVTNFAVWASPSFFYPHTLQGLAQSYIAGLPFFRNTLMGDLFYTGVFFGVYELAMLGLRRRALCHNQSRN